MLDLPTPPPYHLSVRFCLIHPLQNILESLVSGGFIYELLAHTFVEREKVRERERERVGERRGGKMPMRCRDRRSRSSNPASSSSSQFFSTLPLFSGGYALADDHMNRGVSRREKRRKTAIQ